MVSFCYGLGVGPIWTFIGEATGSQPTPEQGLQGAQGQGFQALERVGPAWDLTLQRLNVMVCACPLAGCGWAEVLAGGVWGSGCVVLGLPIDHGTKHRSRQPPAEPSTIPHVYI